MTALHVVLICAAMIFLLLLIRVGVEAEYSESGLLVKLKVGLLSVQAFPRRTKERKPKKIKQEPQPKEKPKRGGAFDLAKEFLPLIAEAAGEFKRKISIDVFRMDLLWSVPDPASCAMGFGGANAAVGMIWPLIEQNFHVKDHRIRTAVDFDRGRPTVYILARMTMRVGKLLSFGIRLVVKGNKVYKAYKTKEAMKQKEAV